MKHSNLCKHHKHICRDCQNEWKLLWVERNELERENRDLKEELRKRKTLAIVEVKQ